MRNNNVTMMSTRVRKGEVKRNFIKNSFKLLLTIAFVLTAFFTATCFADDGSGAIQTAQGLLSKAATAGGGLWAVWGLVTLGMAIKDHNGPGIGNAVWQIVGGVNTSLRNTLKFYL